MLRHAGTSYTMQCPPDTSDRHAQELAVRLAVALGAAPHGPYGDDTEVYRTPGCPITDPFTSVVRDRYRVYLADEGSEIILSCREHLIHVDVIGRPDIETSLVLSQTLTGYAR